MSSSFVYNTYIHSKEKRFGLAQKLATCVMSAGEFEINRTEDEQVMKNALSFYFIILYQVFHLSYTPILVIIIMGGARNW